MNWSNLPDHIIEKFIRCAAEDEFNNQEENWFNWMLYFIHKYGQVCRGWKDVIFRSRMLFDEYDESDDDLALI